MNHSEILQASLLDLLFERRNKQYGAYALRKFYPGRLRLALGITFGSVLLAGVLFSSFKPVKNGSGPLTIVDTVIFVLPPEPPPATEPPKPVLPPQARAAGAFRSAQLTSTIQITDAETDVADQGLLDRSIIGTHTSEGPDAPPDIHTTPPAVNPGPPAAPPATPAEPPVPAGPTVEPSFPGGIDAWLHYLSRNLQAPASLDPGERRSALVKFWVAEDGTVTRFEVLRSAGADFDREVLRVLKRMPRWKPALQNGRPVATSFQQPVTFQAPEE